MRGPYALRPPLICTEHYILIDSTVYYIGDLDWISLELNKDFAGSLLSGGCNG